MRYKEKKFTAVISNIKRCLVCFSKVGHFPHLLLTFTLSTMADLATFSAFPPAVSSILYYTVYFIYLNFIVYLHH